MPSIAVHCADTTRSAPDLVYINGPLVQEVIQTYNPTYNASYFVQQSLRLFSDPAAAAGDDGIDVRTFIDSFMVLGLNHTNKVCVCLSVCPCLCYACAVHVPSVFMLLTLMCGVVWMCLWA